MKEKTLSVTLNDQRNYGIDLLRLISMFMVVVLHVLGKGGVLNHVQDLSVKGEIVWFLEISCYCAVNIFAIISGVVGLKAKHKFSNLILLCIQLTFYAVIITGIDIALAIGNGTDISLKGILFNMFPSVRDVWYFSAYFCLFFFMPLLNAIIENVPRKVLKTSAVFVFLVFCCFAQVYTRVANLNGGYSVLWLAILYLLGAYIAKYDPFKNISFTKGTLAFWICTAFTSLSRIGFGYLDESKIRILVSYTSPTIVLAAVFMVCAFKALTLSNTAKIMIALLAPMSFGVYLIHCHPFVFGKMVDSFVWLADKPAYVVLLIVLAVSFAIFAACLLLDWIRIQLFQACRMKQLSLWIERVIGKISTRILRVFHVTMSDEQ